MRIESVFARSCCAIFILTTCISAAVAQSSKLPHPADPGAASPAVKYQSAFANYQPFQEQKSDSWKQLNKEVANNQGMGSMKDMPGKTTPDMDTKAVTAGNGEKGSGEHDKGSMMAMPGETMTGMESKIADAPTREKPHGEMTMAIAKPKTESSQSAKTETVGITGTGVVQSIDKANGKVKLAHDPIAALGWPKMTMFFRLKDSALADQVTVGDKVEFSLEKSPSGYVVSGFQKGMAHQDMKQRKK